MDADTLEWFSVDHKLPPSFDNNSFVYFAAIFGLMTVFLLAAEWLWRVCWSFRESPKTMRHPVTVTRGILACLLISILMRVCGDVILTMGWADLEPQQRLWIAGVDRMMDGASAAPMFIGWMWGVLGGSMVDWQLARLPIPVNLWPSWREMARPARIGLLVLGIAFTLTWLR